MIFLINKLNEINFSFKQNSKGKWFFEFKLMGDKKFVSTRKGTRLFDSKEEAENWTVRARMAAQLKFKTGATLDELEMFFKRLTDDELKNAEVTLMNK